MITESASEAQLRQICGRLVYATFAFAAIGLFAALFSPILLLFLRPFDFDSSDEVLAQSYNQFAASRKAAWFDPIGASDISHRTSSSRDGYDAWWTFAVSEADFLLLVETITKANHGPAPVTLLSNASPPANWKPQADVPPWWNVGGGANVKGFHWCFAAGVAERHHGWYFEYNSTTGRASCWHWNHQWSSNECR